MKKKKITLKSILSNLDAIICGATLTLCLILVNVNVVFRYFLNNPINWTDEVVTSLFVWTVFMGSAYAHRKHAHLGVDIVVNLVHGKGRKVVELIVSLLEIAILMLLTYISAQYVLNLIFKRGVMFKITEGVFTWGTVKLTKTDTLRIPKWYTGIAVPLGFGLSFIYSVVFFLRDKLHLIKSKEPAAEELAPASAQEPEQIGEGGAY
ncbi:MAG: TRAP transporter small permease [Oscillospiraceae bacterium]|nr:TRAP transporter small permease [Oscillospiraceae bacterium]